MSHIAPAAEPRCAPQTLVRQTPVRVLLSLAELPERMGGRLPWGWKSTHNRKNKGQLPGGLTSISILSDSK